MVLFDVVLDALSHHGTGRNSGEEGPRCSTVGEKPACSRNGNDAKTAINRRGSVSRSISPRLFWRCLRESDVSRPP
jgi:hypothetical protein